MVLYVNSRLHYLLLLKLIDVVPEWLSSHNFSFSVLKELLLKTNNWTTQYLPNRLRIIFLLHQHFISFFKYLNTRLTSFSNRSNSSIYFLSCKLEILSLFWLWYNFFLGLIVWTQYNFLANLELTLFSAHTPTLSIC